MLNRRRFLQVSAGGAAALAVPLGGCGALGGPNLVVTEGDGFPFFDADNRRFEVQPFEHRVVRIGSGGQVDKVIGSAGTEAHELNAPTSLAFGRDRLLYVADRGNSRIQVFERSGQHVGSIGSHGLDDGELNYPTAAAFDPVGRLYVCDTLNHRVARFDRNGTWLGSWGRSGTEPGQLNLPRALAFDRDGLLHVLDSGNARVQTFDSSGSPRFSYGGWGDAAGSMLHPRTLAIGPDGLVYVGDTAAAAVHVFTGRGRFVRSRRLAHGSMPLAPLHLAFTPPGDLHVAAIPAAEA